LLQSAHKDLKKTPHSPAFPLCQRVYNRVLAIIFNVEKGDDLSTSQLTVMENIFPALVGIGMIVASVASPSATLNSRDIILSQGRKGRRYSYDIPVPASPAAQLPTISPMPIPAISNLVNSPMRRSGSMKALALLSSNSPTIEGISRFLY
jgi:hypothetical protein